MAARDPDLPKDLSPTLLAVYLRYGTRVYDPDANERALIEKAEKEARAARWAAAAKAGNR